MNKEAQNYELLLTHSLREAQNYESPELRMKRLTLRGPEL